MSHKHPIIYLGTPEAFGDQVKYKVYETSTFTKRKRKKLVNVNIVYTLAEVLYANDGTFVHASFYKHGLTRHKGRDLIRECLTSNNLSIGNDLRVVVKLDEAPVEIFLSDYLKEKDKFSKFLVDPVIINGNSNSVKKSVVPKSDEESNTLKFAAFLCADDSPMVTYIIFDKGYKSKKATKKHIRTWATVICDTKMEQVKEIHYHKFAFPNGVDLVRQCLSDHEWELDNDTKELVCICSKNGQEWVKSYIPLSEYLDHKEEYTIKNGKVVR